MRKQFRKIIMKGFAFLLAGLMIFGSLDLHAFASQEQEIFISNEEIFADMELPDNHDLFTGYLENLFYAENTVSTYAVGNNTAGSRLTGVTKQCYDALLPIVKQIASGGRTSSVITLGNPEYTTVDSEVAFTGTISDFDSGLLIQALLTDCPYEMYWYDKTSSGGFNCSYPSFPTGELLYITFTFKIASDYCADASTSRTEMNTTLVSAANTAIANANQIVTDNASKSDYEKLLAYAREIAGLVTYDHNATDNNTYSTDIDPWQLINTFDGDTNTNIVCEGYAKSFQYLCDKSTFTDDVSCYCVSGTLFQESGSGDHMWNIVTIGDNHYLADITGADQDAEDIYTPFFLVGGTGSVADGYTVSLTDTDSVSYTYDQEMLSVWGSGEDSILNLSSENYTEETVELNRPTNGTLFVEGFKVDTSQDDSGDNWTYDYDTNTLTVTGDLTGGRGSETDIKVDRNAAIFLGSNELNVIFTSNATLTSNAHAILTNNYSTIFITVKDNVTLNIQSYNRAINVYNLSINGGGTIFATVSVIDRAIVAAYGDSSTINNVTLIGQCKNVLIEGFTQTIIEDSILVKNDETATIYGNATLNTDITVDEVVFNENATLSGNNHKLICNTVSGHPHDSEPFLTYSYIDTGNHHTFKNCPDCPLAIVVSEQHSTDKADDIIANCSQEGYCSLCQSFYDKNENRHGAIYTAEGATIHGICHTCEVEDWMSLNIPSYEYSGLGLVREPEVFDGSNNLFLIDDTEIIYRKGTEILDSPPTEIGTYTASVTYEGATAVQEFSILPLSIENQLLVLSPHTFAYDGTEQIPSLYIERNFFQPNLPDFTYETKYYRGEEETTDFISAGEITVKVTGTGSYRNSLEDTYTITKLTPVASDFVFIAPENLIYDGTDKIVALALNPADIKSGIGEITLKYYKDGLEVTDTASPGIYTVKADVAEGTNFTLATDLTASEWIFEITPKTVTSPVFEGLQANYEYTGSAIEPTFTLKDGETVIPASEYTVSYSNNTELGTAIVTITDKTGGNYTVSGSKTFEIVTHTHVWTYVADDTNDTITATCSGDIGTCPVTDATVVIQLTAPTGEFVYDGNVKTASVTQTPSGAFADLDASDITYTGDMKSVGEHTVSITYGGKTVSASFTITKVDPVYTVPTGLTAVYGDTLEDVTLPANFTWQDKDDTLVGNAGNQIFKATYTPDDTTNYNVIKDIEVVIAVSAKTIAPVLEIEDVDFIYTGTEIKPVITLKDGNTLIPDSEYIISYANNVNAGTASITITDMTGGNYNFTTVTADFEIAKAEKAPDIPSATLNTPYTNKKVSDITLEEGWAWADADKNTELKVGVSVTATANYIGADKENYETISVVVTIIRSECSHSGGTATCTTKATCTTCGQQYGSFGSHGTTEIRGASDATCAATGFTGDGYCTKCGTKVSSGYSVDKLSHSYTTVITKQPTCDNTGVKTHTCPGCGDVLTETILQTGHDYTSKVTEEPTVDKEGVRTYTCKKCDHSYTKTIAKLDPEPENIAPFIKGEGGAEGWEAIKDTFAKAKEDDIFIIDMNNSTIVPSDVISAMKGKDIIVVFDLGNDISWRINGKNVESIKTEAIDFAVTVETPETQLNVIPVDVINALTGDRTSVEISLAYDGKFGFKTVLSINLGKENAGMYANLFYYDPAVQTLEFVSADDISIDGTATLSFEHASDYVIVLDTKSMYNEQTKEPTEDTGTENEVSSETAEEKEPEISTDKEADSSSVNELEKNGSGIIWFLILGGALLIIVVIVVLFAKKRR